MYKYCEPDVNQLEIFEKSLPFGGKLNRNNRWIRLAELIDWHELENVYAQTFSTIGRPGIRARYVIGSLILKYKLDCSDDEVGEHISENPYMQYFIGLPRFQYQPPYDTSTLSNVRQRLGEKEFDKFEEILIKTLTEKKLIKPKGLLTDATVFQSEITFPTDCGLLNKARRFCVQEVKTLSKIVDRKVRTYCRVAQKTYVSFSKKRRKTHKEVRRMQKTLLQYVRRNIRQLSELIEEVKDIEATISAKALRTFDTVKAIYTQQKQMYNENKKSISDRIVSLHKPYIRPIVRGKDGKDVEFGPKVSVSHVDGYLFADHISFDNYHEGTKLVDSIELFNKRFGKNPDYVSMDQIFGSKENRQYLKDHNIRSAVKPLGRPKKNNSNETETRWRRKKQLERNHIEGSIGNSKTKYSLGLVRAKTPKTEFSWIKLALMSRNILIAANRL
ncbi:IS5 family transposase [Candidatus Saccharibacteria bacterium]|nr:IS5 family transposase [Candidatus Saccharibacteria bacterium]NIV03917.1 IS5 family transposase [Calditrichia bacterium]NIV72269.1 IS5 family transposase [Calditrichia bacterium]